LSFAFGVKQTEVLHKLSIFVFTSDSDPRSLTILDYLARPIQTSTHYVVNKTFIFINNTSVTVYSFWALRHLSHNKQGFLFPPDALLLISLNSSFCKSCLVPIAPVWKAFLLEWEKLFFLFLSLFFIYFCIIFCHMFFILCYVNHHTLHN